MEKHKGSRTSPAGTGYGPSPREDLSDMGQRVSLSGARRLPRSDEQPWIAVALGTDVSQLQRGSIVLSSWSAEPGNSTLNPNPRRAPAVALPVPRDATGFTRLEPSCCPCPTVDFGCCFQPRGSERKIRSLTSASESSWETSEEAARPGESFLCAS